MVQHAVLFDLDGTLADTAGDLVAALNDLRSERGLAPVGFEDVKHLLSAGSRGMMRDFLCDPGEDIEPLRERFFASYESQGHVRSRLFPGMAEALDQLEELEFCWGIATNKPTWLTGPLLAKLELEGRMCSVVCGDTLPRAKPDPGMLLHACSACGVQATDVLFLGDDLVDQQAASACSMPFAAVRWSEIWTGEAPVAIDEPAEIFAVLEQLGWLEL